MSRNLWKNISLIFVMELLELFPCLLWHLKFSLINKKSVSKLLVISDVYVGIEVSFLKTIACATASLEMDIFCTHSIELLTIYQTLKRRIKLINLNAVLWHLLGKIEP
jgi:hypothetical protein